MAKVVTVRISRKRFLEECLSVPELAGVPPEDVTGFAVACDEVEDLVVLLAVREMKERSIGCVG